MFESVGRGPLFRGRSAPMIVAMGMPAPIYRLWFLNHGTAAMRRGILNFAGIRPVWQTSFGMVDHASEKTRKSWVERVRRAGATAT
jgi:putative NADPH-quinone reductase